MLDAQRIRDILARTAGQKRTLTYGEILARFGLGVTSSTMAEITHILDRVAEGNARNGEPFLAALVVQQDNALPAPAFFRLLQALCGYVGSMHGPDARAVHQTALDEVWAYWCDNRSISHKH